MVMPIYIAPVQQSSEQDAIGEALAKLATLDQRVSVVRENLSTPAGWWSTATGSDLAEQLQVAIFEIRRLDGLLIEDLRVHDVPRTFESERSRPGRTPTRWRASSVPRSVGTPGHRRRSSCFQRVPGHGRAQRQRDGNGSNVGFPADGFSAEAMVAG